MVENILEIKNISKDYDGTYALDNISMNFKKGEIHALVGENGAGKSTLIKIISGAVKPCSGEVYYKGKNITYKSPREIIELGISVVYQELNVINNFKVYENIFYGSEKTKGIFLDKRYMQEKSKEILDSMDVDIDVNTNVKDIGIGNQQILEIAHSLVYDIEVLILDEPTASLTKKETELLFKVINKLKDQGVSIIYISHRLEEIISISDRITVLRDGKHIVTTDNKVSENELIHYMVGRELTNDPYYKKRKLGDTVLELENISTKYVNNISFTLRKGEILGLSGLVYSGRTEVARGIVGIDNLTKGNIRINNKYVNIKSPRDAIHHGIYYITEDRKNLGLIMNMSICKNSTYSILDKLSNRGIVNVEREVEESKNILSYLKTKYKSIKDDVKNLSGGNQQKVLISKSLLANSQIIIFDEPTRGVDVGAKQEIYRIIMNLAEAGKSIILISSEMPEVIGLSDRILVMSNGQLVSSYDKEDITQEKIFRDSASLLKGRDYD